MPSPQESPLEQLSSLSVQLPCPAARLPLGSSVPRQVISCSDIPPRKNIVVSNFKCVGLLLDYWIGAWDSSLNFKNNELILLPMLR